MENNPLDCEAGSTSATAPSPLNNTRNLRPTQLSEKGKAISPPSVKLCQQALVIGIGNYKHVSPLANAPKDAQAITDLLRDEYGFNILPQGQALLNEIATLENIQEAVQSSLKAADALTRWLFYFAGHGDVIEKSGYLLPVDAEEGKLRTCLSLVWLIEACKASECAEILIILDACYGGQALVRQETLDDLIPANDLSNRVIQIVSSGNPREPVMDGGGSEHSVFTQSLLEALRGWAGIHNENGAIRFSRLLDHLVFDVSGHLYAAGLSTTLQRPVGGYLRRGSQEQSDFIFQSLKPRLAPQIAHNAHADDSSWREAALTSLTMYLDEPILRQTAIQLASAHTRRAPSPKTSFLIAGFLGYEPSVEVRSRASQVLGELKAVEAWPDLVIALDDEPSVCQAAAGALGQLKISEAANALLQRLKTASGGLFLKLMDSIGMLGESQIVLDALRLTLQQNKLVLFIGPDFPKELTGVPDRVTIAQKLGNSSSLADAAKATIRDQSWTSETCPRCGSVVERSGNRYEFTRFIKDHLDARLLRPEKIHLGLASLPAKLWLTTAYDGLLVKALDADRVIGSADAAYLQPDHPTVICLAGDLIRINSLRVLEVDYRQRLRTDAPLAAYLRQVLQGKITLFLGFNPDSPDFDLLVKYILNEHLADLDICAFQVCECPGEVHKWGEHRLHPLISKPLDFVETVCSAGK